MSDFLRELGYSPANYWLFAGATFLLWFVSALVPRNPSDTTFARFNRPELFGVLLLVAMFAWRWPAIFYYKPVNPDESQFIAAALTNIVRGNIWWSDTMTAGPLVVLPLTLPNLVGLPVNIASARLIGLLLDWLIVYLGYLSLSHVHGERKSRLLITPLACLMIFLLYWDFVPYCSERSPLFLCALAIWLSLTAFQPDGLMCHRWRLIGSGFVLGIISFSKFQVLPIAAAIGISTVAWVIHQPAVNRKNIRRDLFCLIGSTVGGFALMLFSLSYSGHWSEFYESYLMNNLHYTQNRSLPWSESGHVLSYLTGLSWGFYSFHVGILALLAVAQIGLRRSAWRPIILAWSLLIATYCAVLVPGRLYPHYLFFLSLPLSLLLGLQFGYLLQEHSRRYCKVYGALFICLGAGTQVIDRLWDRHSLHKLIAVPNARDQVVRFINQEKQPGDTLAVWGWLPELYVETQLPQATRESVTEVLLNANPQREFFRTRFIIDLHTNRPAFFVDSVGPDDFLLRDRNQQGHENIPGLENYIREHYSQVRIANSFRVYVRRDRLTPIR